MGRKRMRDDYEGYRPAGPVKCKTFSQWLGSAQNSHTPHYALKSAVGVLLGGFISFTPAAFIMLLLGPIGSIPGVIVASYIMIALNQNCDREYRKLLVEEGRMSPEDAIRR